MEFFYRGFEILISKLIYNSGIRRIFLPLLILIFA